MGTPRDMTNENGPVVGIRNPAPPFDSADTRPTGHRRSRNAKSASKNFQGRESIRTVDLFDDNGGGDANTRSTDQRRSRNAKSFQGKSIRTVDFDGDGGDDNRRSTGQRRSRNANSFQGKSSIRIDDFDRDDGDDGPASFRDSFPLSRKEGQARHQRIRSSTDGLNRKHSDLFAELSDDDHSDDGQTRHQKNKTFHGKNRKNVDLGYDAHDHGSSFKQALAETRAKPRKYKSFHVVDFGGNNNDYKPSKTRSSSHRSFHAVDDNDIKPSKTRRSPRGRANLGKTMRPGDYKSHRRASIESTKSSFARETYLPTLELGDAGNHEDMVTENDHQAAMELLDSSLEKNSFCFTRRSNGSYTYSIVADKDDSSITVVVDEIGSTKSCLRKDWPTNFRLVDKKARLKKWDETRLKKSDEKALRLSTATGVLSLFD